jgi:hypothetical protein
MTIIIVLLFTVLLSLIFIGFFYSIMVIFFRIEKNEIKNFIKNLFIIENFEEEKSITKIIKYIIKSANIA